MNEPKYPSVVVTLVGQDGNAMSLIGMVSRELRRQGKVPEAERMAFFNEATSGDYDHVLQTIQRWVSTDVDDMA